MMESYSIVLLQLEFKLTRLIVVFYTERKGFLNQRKKAKTQLLL